MTMADPLAEAPLEAGALLADPAAAPVLLLVLEQAAASTATPTAPPTPAASLAGNGIRFTLEFHIDFLLPSSTAVPREFRPPTWASIQVRDEVPTGIGGEPVNSV
jgi:hypothetical protein